jgi:RNA polymerase sigma-70 factor (ECF subfamily)
MNEETLLEDLLRRVTIGDDQRAFSQLFGIFHLRLVYFTNRLIADEQMSEEIVSGAFNKLWQLRHAYQGKTIADVRAFLYTVCRNDGYTFLKRGAPHRKRVVLTSDVDELLDPEEKAEYVNHFVETEVYHKLYSAIELLPPGQKNVLKLFLENNSIQEIADQLNMTNLSVRQSKFKAIENLRNTLTEHFPIGMVIALLPWLFEN